MSQQSPKFVSSYFRFYPHKYSSPKAKRNIADARASLHEALDKFESNGLLDRKISFLSGVQCPDMGDVAVFGVLSSVKGLNAHKDAIQSRGGHVRQWYDRMHQQVLES